MVNFKTIEKKWQSRWQSKKIFEVSEKKGKKKYYVLEMFPYPSGEGLHMGHAFNYVIGDIFARFKRMSGFNVLYPMGYDSLGLPAENAAIKARIHPKKYTEKSIKNFIKQQKELGLSYDWSRIVISHDTSYYKWDQWIFLKMFEKGLAFRKKASVNFCSKCQTVLANEQVHDGTCWRHPETGVEIKQLEQWFFKITDYADELYEDIAKLKDWPEDVKAMQKNWIGKSHGTEIDFEVKNENINCVIVHGSPSKDRTKEKNYVSNNLQHWIPWLKKELENRGIKVDAPQMSTPWAPKYEEWKSIMDKLTINERSILIGHSAGGAFLVRWLGENKKKIKKLILVSPGKAGHEGRKVLTNFYGAGTDKSIKDNINEIVIFTADDDIDYHIPVAYEYQKEIGGKLIHLGKGYGHFCEGDMGTKEFPGLLDEIIKRWKIFTTRSDTIYGVTFMVVSAQHPKLMELVTSKQKTEVEKFLRKIKTTSMKDLEELDKEGAFTGSYAVNPVNNEKIPVYVGNFVVADYGSGMVMAVPSHDQRDWEFAKKYNLLIKEVISGGNIKERAYADEGIMVNSGKFNGISSEKAKEEIAEHLTKLKKGRKKIEFRLKDWLISRQRYWGTPIPIIYCGNCGIVPVPEKDLPVKLPEKVKFGKGNPLATNKKFVNTKCPKCKGKAKRETDTMDTFVNSSWYFLRYCDAKNKKQIFDKKKVAYWMPVDTYIGGKEHACMHLIYFRFYTKFLRDIGLLKFDEPALRLFNQGMLHGPDGAVMSKSRGNVILPEQVSKKYGIDTARLFLVSLASPDKDIIWSDNGIQGSLRFVNKVYDYFSKIKFGKVKDGGARLKSKLNKTIKEVTEDIQEFRYNLAIIKIKQLFDSFDKIDKKTAESFLKLLSPFCPHLCEELWQKIRGRGFISLADWPRAGKVDEQIIKQEKSTQKLVEDINNILKILENRGQKANKVYVYTLPREKDEYFAEDFSKIGLPVKIFAVNDKKKFDPTNKSKNSKPGKPAIYIE